MKIEIEQFEERFVAMPMTMLMEQVANYPIDDRVAMADAILASLNGADPAVEAAWASIADRRLRELKRGRVRGVPAGTVFARAQSDMDVAMRDPALRNDVSAVEANYAAPTGLEVV